MNRHTLRRSLLPRAAMTGAGLIGLGWVIHLMPEATPGRVYWPWLLLTGVLVLTGVGLVWRNQRGGSAGLVNRWARRVGAITGWPVRGRSCGSPPGSRCAARPVCCDRVCAGWDGGAGSSRPAKWPRR